jgi:hypothetical protein
MTADNIGRQVAAANTALDENQVAGIIFAGLFETGPHRTTSAMKYVALQGIKAALVEWKKQLLAAAGRDVDKYKSAHADAKRELDELKLKVAIWKKEGKV